MADTVQTDPTAKGTSTSEFKLATAVAAAGAILAGLSETVGQLSHVFPESKWLAAVGVAMGALMAILSALGYNNSRTLIKTQMIQSGATADAKPNP